MLVWILFAAGTCSLVNKAYPVCIIGGGITGLTLAHHYEERQIPYIVFEKESVPGGKAVTGRDPDHQYQVDMGPLLFAKNSTNSLSLFDKLGFSVSPRPHGEFTAFELGTNFTLNQPKPDIVEAQERYFQLRSTLDLKKSNLDADSNLHVSLGTWLEKNDLNELIPPSQIMVSISGYGSVFETPALYGLRILDEHGDLRDPLYVVEAGLDKAFLEYAKELNIQYNKTVKRIITRSQMSSETSVEFESSAGLEVQRCDKIITAFPPLYDSLHKIMDNSSSPLIELMKQVKINKFATFAIDNHNLQDHSYFPLLKSNPIGFINLPGNGHVAGLVKQDSLYSCYVWINGPSSSPASSAEFSQMKQNVYKDIDDLVNDPNSTQILFSKNWEYFPHVNTDSLNNNFYNKLDKLQGNQGIYIGGPLLSFETIHHSIAAAQYLIDTYLI